MPNPSELERRDQPDPAPLTPEREEEIRATHRVYTNDPQQIPSHRMYTSDVGMLLTNLDRLRVELAEWKQKSERVTDYQDRADELVEQSRQETVRLRAALAKAEGERDALREKLDVSEGELTAVYKHMDQEALFSEFKPTSLEELDNLGRKAEWKE